MRFAVSQCKTQSKVITKCHTTRLYLDLFGHLKAGFFVAHISFSREGIMLICCILHFFQVFPGDFCFRKNPERSRVSQINPVMWNGVPRDKMARPSTFAKQKMSP